MVSWLIGLYNAITKFIETVWESLTDWAKDFLKCVFETFEGQSREFVTDILSYLGDLIDSNTGMDVSSLGKYLDAANLFIPLSEGGVLLGAWVSLAIYVYSSRIITKLIPFIG